jgi:hypothetical protein
MTMAIKSITHQSILSTRNQIELSDNNFLAKDTVQLETEISLRQAVTQCSDASICDGQGFTKCGCSPEKKVVNSISCLKVF